MVTSFDISHEIFSIDMLTGFKSSLKHRRNHVAVLATIWRPEASGKCQLDVRFSNLLFMTCRLDLLLYFSLIATST